jgi:hypothetical protein
MKGQTVRETDRKLSGLVMYDAQNYMIIIHSSSAFVSV